MIIDPVVIDGMDEDDYHAHPALSSSGARRLLSPSCPALFHHEQTHGGRPDTDAFDFGHAAHQLVLGAGKPIVRIYADLDAQRDANAKAAAKWAKEHPEDDAPPFRPAPLVVHAPNMLTNHAKAQAAAARRAGGIPLLVKDVRRVLEMAKVLKRHPLVGGLFDRDRGRAEVSMFWHDERAGVDRRARFDWLPNKVEGRQIIVPDYKSAESANPDSFAKSVASYGYHQQDPWYRDAGKACLGEDILFLFVVQEKRAPYLVQVFELSPETVEVGRAKNDVAMAVYRDCLENDTWPAYSSGIVTVELPGWADRNYL